MNRKFLGILGSLVIVLMIGVFVSSRDNKINDEFIGSRLMPDLEERLAQVSSVEIRSDSGSITITKTGSLWGIKEKNNYRADFSKLSGLITGLSEAMIVERKTSREKNLDLLQLSSEKATKATLNAGDKIYSILLGKSPSDRKGRYVRFPDDNQAWLIDKELEMEDSLSSWLDPIIINVDSESVERVVYTTPTGGRMEVQRVEGEENLQLRGLRPSQKLKYESAPNELARALVNVRLQDIYVESSTEGSIDWGKSSNAEFYLVDGSAVSVKALEKDQKKLLKFSLTEAQTSNPDENSKAEADAGASGESDEDGEAIKDTTSNAAVVTEAIEKKIDLSKYQGLSRYVFEVTDFVYDEFTKTLDDMIEEKNNG